MEIKGCTTARPTTLIKNKTTNNSGCDKNILITNQRSYKLSSRQKLLKLSIFSTIVFLAGISLTPIAKASFFDIFNASQVTETTGSFGEIENSQTVSLLQGAKNIDPNLARGGGDVYIESDTALVAENTPFAEAGEDVQAPANSDQISLYIVQEGDTLSQVAKMFNVSVNTVVWGNELSSNKDIQPGQTLLILPISGVQHVVKKGDTLKSLAKKYSGDASEITVYNDLPEDGTLTVGETVTIPGGVIEVEEEKPVTTKYTKVATGGTSVSGYFRHPLPGSVKTQGIHGYNAIDFGAPAGTPILAAAGGRVIVSRVGAWNGGYGNYVVIEHLNGTQTLYAHNTSNEVWQGQAVVAGQVIGYVGSTGRSTGNHLHFEVRGAKNPF